MYVVQVAGYSSARTHTAPAGTAQACFERQCTGANVVLQSRFCVAVKCLDMVWDVSKKDNFSAVRNNSFARSLRIAKLFLLAQVGL